jgi:lysozyme family protein
LVAEEQFERCLAQVLRHEGGFADHPDDPGGATNMGITRQTLAAWRGVTPVAALPVAAVRNLSGAEAAQIYRAKYWAPVGAATLPVGLDLALFDFAVHSGPSRAVKTLQAELGVGRDGILGPVTLKALEQRVARVGADELIDALCGRRLQFLAELSTFAVFGKGWTARVAAIRQTALNWSPAAPIPTKPRSMSMTFLSGYKTYIVAALMLLTGLAQALGLEVPTLEGSSAGQLMMEAVAVLLLRRGLKANAASS